VTDPPAGAARLELARLFEEHLQVPAPRPGPQARELVARLMRYDLGMVQAVRSLLRGQAVDRHGLVIDAELDLAIATAELGDDPEALRARATLQDYKARIDRLRRQLQGALAERDTPP
jgi:hypothetical protein